MDILSNLTKTTAKAQKRRGRGYGSGAGGHTTGRGAKGDKIRGKSKLTFDGTKIKKSWVKRTPFLRGKHRVLPLKKYLAISLGDLDKWFKDKDTVNLKSLSKKIPQSKLKNGVKILNNGQLTKALHFKGIKFSATAKDKILAASGTID